MRSRIAGPGAGATFITLLMSGLSLFGQPPTGYLAGTVFDQAGARLGHAAVIVKNAATGVESATHPSGKGDYRFENLPAGRYSIRVSATGLATVQINDVLIQNSKTSTINVTLPVSQSTPISVVEVSEAPEPQDTPAPAPVNPPQPQRPPPQPLPPPQQPLLQQPQPPPPDNADDSKIVLRQIAGIRDRLALSADQQMKIRDIFQDRQTQVADIRGDSSLPWPARRERIRAIRADAETKFRALLNENQLDEYEEILRERREHAMEKQNAALSPPR